MKKWVVILEIGGFISSALMIFVSWILLAGLGNRFRVGYEELLAINPLLKECGDNLTMINEEVMREIKDFKNYIKFVIIYNLSTFAVTSIRGILTLICLIMLEIAQRELKRAQREEIERKQKEE